MKALKLRGLVGKTLCVLALATLVASCKKDEPTVATVIVTNEDGERIAGANVRLYTNSSNPSGQANRFDFNSITDGNGEVSFDLSDQTMPGQTGFAVLDIKATYVDTAEYEGIGIIKVIEHEEANEDVIITKVTP